MAKLKNIGYFTFDRRVWAERFDQFVTVGHNRRIRLHLDPANSDKVRLSCYLHGSPVAVFEIVEDGLEVFLNSCGYLTTTTIAAMTDFMRAMGVGGSASRAGGELSALYVRRGTSARVEFEQMPTGHVRAVIPFGHLDT